MKVREKKGEPIIVNACPMTFENWKEGSGGAI